MKGLLQRVRGANGPIGMGPPNSSAIIVSTQGTSSPRAAQAVA